MSDGYSSLSIRLNHAIEDHRELKTKMESFRKVFYSYNFEAKYQRIDSKFEALCVKLDSISDTVDKLKESDKRQEKILYIGTGIFLTLQFATSSFMSPIISRIFNG